MISKSNLALIFFKKIAVSVPSKHIHDLGEMFPSAKSLQGRSGFLIVPRECLASASSRPDLGTS